MDLLARLVHAEAGARVVLVEARTGERLIASALGEAVTAEEAEDRARRRLLVALQAQQELPEPEGSADPAPNQESRRLVRPAPQLPRPAAALEEPRRPGPTGQEPAMRMPPQVVPPAPRPVPAPSAPQPTGPQPAAPPPSPEPEAQPDLFDSGPAPELTTPAPPQSDPISEPEPDPEDWSGELVAVERQLRRLAWGREQEAIYLQRAFGHPSRSRLTRYSDLRAYLQALEAMEPAADAATGAAIDPAAAPVPLRRADLLAQAEGLMAQLGWGPEQGRSLLERELGCSSRSQLSDAQLLQFNMLLEGELLDAAAAPLEGGSDSPSGDQP